MKSEIIVFLIGIIATIGLLFLADIFESKFFFILSVFMPIGLYVQFFKILGLYVSKYNKNLEGFVYIIGLILIGYIANNII